MRLFDRTCEVSIVNESGRGTSVSEDFRISFQITKTLSSEANSIDVSIQNLSRATQKKLLDVGDFIEVKAGYERTEILALGEITRIFVEQELPDSFLKVEAGDGIRTLNQRQVNVSFDAGTPAERILTSVLGDISLPRLRSRVKLSKTYAQGFSFSGSAFDFLNIITRKEDLFWSIQNGQLILLDFSRPESREAVVLSAQTGLIGSPEPLDDFGLVTNRKVQSGWKVRSLLNPKVQPASGIQLDSSVIKGSFLVDTVTFFGDTRGQDWFCEVDVYG